MSDEMNRRTAAGLTLAMGAGALLTKVTDAGAQARRPTGTAAATPSPAPGLLAAPPEKVIVPLPYAPTALPGLSERLLTSHHDNNYGSAVRKLNEIRTQLASADPAQSGPYWSLYGSLKSAELAARNSSLLHELYFANLAPAQQPSAAIAQMLAQRFGSLERFQAQFRGCALAASGWVVLVADPMTRTLEIVQTEGHAFGAWEAAPILVLDVFEHAFAIDFGANKGAYFDAFWRNVNWTEATARASRASSAFVARS
jgi:Fe-Mn family superoxide dismutase